ncbi:MAG: branched-chain amino acid aminotransferase [Deltaproteobacteria bacterium]|nr:branched-chain amino acid aminotransferase [Deltaproteobacteria bacterium]
MSFSSAKFPVTRTTTPRTRPVDSALKFGTVFADHMLLLDYKGDAGWHNGRIVPYETLPMDPAAAGIHYAQTLFDGLKAYRGVDGKIRIFRLPRHAARLAEGAKRMSMPDIDPELIAEAIKSIVSADEAWIPSSPGTALYIRPTIFASEAFLGVRPAKQYQFFIINSPVGAYYAEGFGPVSIRIEDKYVRAAPGGLGAVKAGANYAASLMAAEEAKAAGFAQVLWTDAIEHAALEEVGTMNLFVRIGDEVATPALTGTILSGVTRASVIDLLRSWGMTVNERRITVEELLSAQRKGQLTEVFGTGTGAVISPVGELGWKDQRFAVGTGQPGDLSQKLFKAITDIQYGHAEDKFGWLTEV